MDDSSVAAARQYIRLKLKAEVPRGKLDSSGRWYPMALEECCTKIRQPSRAYPFSLLAHCRSIKHLAVVYQVTEQELRSHLRKKNLPLLLGMDPIVDKYIERVVKGYGRNGNMPVRR